MLARDLPWDHPTEVGQGFKTFEHVRAACLVIADCNELAYIHSDWDCLRDGLQALLRRVDDYRLAVEGTLQRLIVDNSSTTTTSDGADRELHVQALRDLLVRGIAGDACPDQEGMNGCEQAHVPPAGSTMSHLEESAPLPTLVCIARGVLDMLHRRCCRWRSQLLEMEARKLDCKLAAKLSKGQKSLEELRQQFERLLVPTPNTN